MREKSYTANKEDRITIIKIIQNAAHLLPSQSPLQFFIHHNTLHNFENLQFKDALLKASQEYNSEAFMDESFFQRALFEKRITINDIDQIILQECKNSNEYLFGNKGPTYFDFYKWRLLNLFPLPSEDSLDWFIYENRALEKPHKLAGSALKINKIFYSKKELVDLWKILEVEKYSANLNKKPIRIRDKILVHTNFDIDQLVQPLLIKLSSAYLDQGLAFDAMPERNAGFLASFHKIYSNRLFYTNWMKNLSDEISKQKNMGLDAVEIIIDILNILEVEEKNYEEFILQSLLSLKGWAGMFFQYENFPDRIPFYNIPAKVVDFLAVQLTLELTAIKFVMRKKCIDFSDLNNDVLNIDFHSANQQKILQYEAFIVAQAFGIKKTNFDINNKPEAFYNAVKNFNNFEQRYYLHLAYENNYRQIVIDSLINHQKFLPTQNNKCFDFQVLTCFDEREESFRRHLKEIYSNVQTFGVAGFFGVAMQYMGLEDSKPRALCPAAINPNVLVEEVACDNKLLNKYLKRRKIFGKIFYLKRNINNSLILGALWNFTLGIFKPIPLTLRILFPLLATKISRYFLDKISIDKPHTRLKIEKFDDKKKFGFQVGFSIEEMANIVFTIFNSINLKNFSPLVIIVGHGSSSVNNPHEAAYNCGAVGGAKGFANARAFAMMANHDKVRKKLAEKGLPIPHDTKFIAAYFEILLAIHLF